MRSSLVLSCCSALALILAGCSGSQAAGGFTPQPPAEKNTLHAEATREAQPDTAFGIAEFTTNTGETSAIASDGAGHEFVGAEEPQASLLRFDEQTHAYQQFNLPQPAGGPYALALQGTKAMWFTSGNVVGSMQLVTHTFQEFTVPTPSAAIEGIALGTHQSMWFTEAQGGKVGRIRTDTGAISEYPLPTPNHPFGIALGQDGAIWFANYQSIDRITADGQLSDYPIGQNYPTGVTTGPDGAIWFTGQSDQNGGLIGRIDLNTHVRKIAKFGAGTSADVGIVTRGSQLWMTAPNANRIDRYDPSSHVVTRKPLPKGFSRPFGIALGADDQLWFTNDGPRGSAIGKLCPDQSSQTCKTSP
ncbi:MAG TPA: hypothetical protein VFE16_06980 [Candidatus Cybelea sp.]|jgi:virginiamycin B lyase|nr:hypothetical protein [Candidatus Cybelea sp.]